MSLAEDFHKQLHNELGVHEIGEKLVPVVDDDP